MARVWHAPGAGARRIPAEVSFGHGDCNSITMSQSMEFDEPALRAEARRRVALGRLPSQPQQYLWAGAGNGQPCSLCDRPIDAGQIEYELQFNTRPLTVYRFHRICHEAWELEGIP
jgi:hypothetical protein